MSILPWKSRKLKRKCSRQFGAETLAVNEGMAMAEFYRVMLNEIMSEQFELTRPYALASDYQVVGLTDSKGGFDHITNPR